MATTDPLIHPSQLDRERQALASVLASATFRKNPRLSALLTYICQKYFEGESEKIKEYSIAVDVFRRSESFDQSTHSIVRVEVYRLRRKLRDFYLGEGAGHPLQIVLETGHYLPKFVERDSAQAAGEFQSDAGKSLLEAGDLALEEGLPLSLIERGRAAMLLGKVRSPIWFWLPAVSCLAILAGGFVSHRRSPQAMPAPSTAAAIQPIPGAGSEIRIRCGYGKALFKDEEGNLWTGDRFFSGGEAIDLPAQHIDRTRDPNLYLSGRVGSFSYRIPLQPGTYEMRLHFAETTYTPSSTLGGGENSRVFNVRLNGAPLLTQFDIVSDAGASTADVRVFRDVHPGADGFLTLELNGILGMPLMNAIEIVPGLSHRQLPIRMVAQNSFFVDREGNLWSPDNYFSGGQIGADKLVVQGTDEPGLYDGHRYGNFSYALPADRGTYTLTLHFAETYWGTEVSKTGGAGSRVFDVFCNGVVLLRDLDVAKEAGPGRALTKMIRGLHPNAQGKVVVTFVPNVNYALLEAMELEQESQ